MIVESPQHDLFENDVDEKVRRSFCIIFLFSTLCQFLPGLFWDNLFELHREC